MTDHTLDITPSVTVHKLLEAYPELEEVLIGIAPPFKKLKNPFLRRSVAKVATLKHIAVVGGVPLQTLVNQLREAVGQDASAEAYNDEDYFTAQPEWFAPENITYSLEEGTQANTDEMTLVTIIRETKDVQPGEIIELITTFLPAPGIDTLKAKGYQVWSRKEDGGIIKTYFLKPQA